MSETQDQEMRQILANLEVLSHGATQSWNASGSADKPDSKAPVGDTYPPHEEYRSKYVGCASDHARDKVIEAASSELRSWRSWLSDRKQEARNLASDAEILDQQILDAVGFSVAEVAVRYRCTETRVRKVRLMAGVSGTDGARLAPVADALEGRDRVRELGARGMTERQISMLTGKATSTVRRILGRAA